eukprot:m.176662 g.176662  ORF g.176662 m.176662 type:complete len:98 (+) comp15446_c0_seq11:2606-2899(+)
MPALISLAKSTIHRHQNTPFATSCVGQVLLSSYPCTALACHFHLNRHFSDLKPIIIHQWGLLEGNYCLDLNLKAREVSKENPAIYLVDCARVKDLLI